MSHDVFISYSTLDKAAADAACATLEASGIRCWIAPRDITPGTEWGDAIIGAISNSRVMVLIFSANANDSPQIRREVERAVHKGIPILPLRIEDIAPTHSLEYFIGTVHWLDALTPPLEIHLLRLAESVRALLQIDPTPPPILSRSVAAASSASPSAPKRSLFAAIALAGVGLVAVAVGIWWFAVVETPRPHSASSAPATPHVPTTSLPAAPQPPTAALKPIPVPIPTAAVKPAVDPLVVGTFARDSVADGYAASYVYAIAVNGTCHLITNLQESGTVQGGNGRYRTISITGYIRTGTYKAVGSAAIQVTNAGGTAVFQPLQPIPPLNQLRPVMLGAWRTTVVQDGVSLTWTVENNPDGTYVSRGQSDDSGSCTFADHQWRSTSTVTGRSDAGTYRLIDPRTIEITSADGSTVWRRQQ